MGNTEFRTCFHKLSLAAIAVEYGWTIAQLRRNIEPIQKDLKAMGLVPRRALTPKHVRHIFDHLGPPKSDNLYDFF